MRFYWDQDLTAADFFCGAGGFGYGIERGGARLNLAINHDVRSIATHRENFPHAKHLCMRMETVDFEQEPDSLIGTGSPECFPAETLILTEQGLIPIEEISIGTNVLTHRNRWMPVTAMTKSIQTTVIIRGHGHYGLEVTPHHPFLARRSPKSRSHRKRTYHDPEWIEASGLGEAFWCTPTSAESLPVPPVNGRGVHFSPEFWWMVGRWVGDGTVRTRIGQGAEITICCGHHEADELERQLSFAPPTGQRAGHGEFRWRRRQIRTATLFETGHNGLVSWLLEHFGKLAHGKKIPAWALTMPVEWRQAFLDGYLSADGFTVEKREKVGCSTVSRKLAFGIRLLAESLGHRVALQCYEPRGNPLEGRNIKERRGYLLTWLLHRKHEQGLTDEQHSWLKVKDVQPGRQQIEVFNLSIAVDESYIADGLVVHNCTFHSPSAGEKLNDQGQLSGSWTDRDERPCIEQSRMSMWQVYRAAEAKAKKGSPYHSMIFENVVEVASKWGDYYEWRKNLQALDYEYQALYLNAMFFGVPQRRDRWFGVFWKRGAKRPEITFRPAAFCPSCEEQVRAVQSWKIPTRKWGKYSYHPKSGQYTYRCPRCATRVHPCYRPAAAVVDVTDRGVKIGERKQHGLPPLDEKTMQRIQDGIDRFFKRSQTVPMEAVDVPSFDGPAPFWLTYYSNGKPYSIYEPFCTFSTKERCGIVFPPDSGSLDIQECRYRMLNEREVRGGSGLPPEYTIKAETKEELVRQCGHMVPPPMGVWVAGRVIAAM